jgi:hypothetical protein
MEGKTNRGLCSKEVQNEREVGKMPKKLNGSLWA